MNYRAMVAGSETAKHKFTNQWGRKAKHFIETVVCAVLTKVKQNVNTNATNVTNATEEIDIEIEILDKEIDYGYM